MNIMPGDDYITLMTSLPYAGQLFTAKQTPLSRFKLEQRLKMLETEDAEVLRQIEALLQWSNQSMSRTDADIIEQARQLVQQLENPLVQEVVTFYMELRTVVAALRRRKLDDKPLAGEFWGYGRWVAHIQRYWTEPAFRLQGVYPWILEADRLLRANDAVALERLLIHVVWDKLGRLTEEHYFDFEALLVYVLRWDMIERWVGYEGEAAVKRFAKLVDSGMGEYEKVFTGGTSYA